MRGVTKRFGRTVALDGVSTVIPKGSIVGLIGRNGCGKTTLLRHAAGLLVANAGECLTLGVPAPELEAEQLARMGVVHQHDPLLPFMRVGQLVGDVATQPFRQFNEHPEKVMTSGSLPRGPLGHLAAERGNHRLPENRDTARKHEFVLNGSPVQAHPVVQIHPNTPAEKGMLHGDHAQPHNGEGGLLVNVRRQPA